MTIERLLQPKCDIPSTADANRLQHFPRAPCRIRGTTSDAVCRSIGMGGRRALDVHLSGLRALDFYRVCQIADRLDVSVDWLLGRSDVMDIPRKGTRVA